MTTKPPIQKILKGTLHIEHENKHIYERIGITKTQEKSRQVIREWHRSSYTHCLIKQINILT
jgi:hypothetical protein